jgi:hypothetical protein
LPYCIGLHVQTEQQSDQIRRDRVRKNIKNFSIFSEPKSFFIIFALVQIAEKNKVLPPILYGGGFMA